MKRILIAIIAAMILMPTMADAQIQVEKHPKIEKIKSARFGVIDLKKMGDSYYIALSSSNRYDDPYIINLGDDKQSTINSLNSLIEICETITNEDTFEFNDGVNDFLVFRGTVKGELWIRSDGYAGHGIILKSDLNSFLRAMMIIK